MVVSCGPIRDASPPRCVQESRAKPILSGSTGKMLTSPMIGAFGNRHESDTFAEKKVKSTAR
jgi:hypothetical protein